MRILSLTWGFSLGGIGKCLLVYHRLTEQEDFDVHTVCIQLENINHNLKLLKDIDSTIIHIKSRHDFSWIRKCQELIDHYQPDLLFVHGFNGPVVAKVLQWKLGNKIPFVCSYHGKYHAPTAVKRIVGPLYNFVQERIYKSSAFRVVTCADYCSEYLISKGVPEEKVTVVHNGVDASVPKRKVVLRNDLGIEEDDIVLGVASRIDPVKGIKYLFEAFTQITKTNKRVHLVLVGDGTLTKKLQRKAIVCNIKDSVHFVGYQSNILEWLDIFDIFVLPSLAEYHSIALLEAMRSGKAIVATDVGGNTESVRHEKEAIIVPAANSKALEEALVKMIEQPQLRERLSFAARKRFELEFTEQRMLEKLVAWFYSFESELR